MFELSVFHAVPRAPLGRSDHAMVYLIPTYTQKLKSDKPLKKSVTKWTQDAILYHQGCFNCTDWAMFSEFCANQDEYADTVTSYVSFCTDSCIPSKTDTIYANEKPWFSKDTNSNTNSLQKNYDFKTRIKTSTKQSNVKLRRLSEEQKHSTEISLKNSSQHPTGHELLEVVDEFNDDLH